MDPSLFQSIWQFLQDNWQSFMHPMEAAAATQTGKQLVEFVSNRLTHTGEGKAALAAAATEAENPEPQRAVKALLVSTIAADPQFASDLEEKWRQVSVTQNIYNEGANIDKQINIGTNSGPITM